MDRELINKSNEILQRDKKELTLNTQIPVGGRGKKKQ